MEAEDAILMDAGDDARLPGGDDAGEGPEGGLVEIEFDGQIYQVPEALKGAFLMNADYTRKTQELAEQRRTMLAERQAFEARARQAQASLADHGRLAALDEQLAEFETVDWELYAAQEPQAAQTLWAQFQALREAREQYAWKIAHQTEQSRIQAEQEAAERMMQAGRVLSKEIEGWSPEVAMKLVEYAQAFGVTLEEMREVADPRLWKLLHRAHQADEQARQQETARAVQQVQAVRPAVQVSGAAASSGGVRDELGTTEWMRRRNELAARGR